MFIVLLMAVILFASAGRLNWTGAWIAIGIVLANLLSIERIILPRNPHIMAERDTATWDRLLYPLIALYFPVCTWVVAGLDIRFGWTKALSAFVMIAALLITILGLVISSWAMLSNKYYTGTVVIQKNRGHKVAVNGPYKYVRHPSYAGALLFYLALPFLLGSLWALIPSGIASLFFVIRTILEDRMLRKEFEGYNSYASRVKYYLIPGIW